LIACLFNVAEVRLWRNHDHGIKLQVLTRLVAVGKLERVARGVYGLPTRPLNEHCSLAEVCLRVPRGVVCLLSALRVHDIGTQAPFQVWLAIPHHSPAPRLDRPAVRVVRMSGPSLTEGIEPMTIDGVRVPVFNAAKTIADCFKVPQQDRPRRRAGSSARWLVTAQAEDG